MKLSKKPKAEKTEKQLQAAKERRKWIVTVCCGTFILTFMMNWISNELLSGANMGLSFVILFVIIALGIITDMIGIAVTSVALEPFNAMASRRIPGAKTAVSLVKNAAKVSSVCNDVIGDICGVISGGVAVSITAKLAAVYGLRDSTLLGLIIAAAVSMCTVGGKAICKQIAMDNAVSIVSFISRGLAKMRPNGGKAKQRSKKKKRG